MTEFSSSWFTEEFERRRQTNASYSVRAFARDLGIGKSTTWEAICGRRVPTRPVLLRVARKLALGPASTEDFVRRLGVPDGRARAQPLPPSLALAEDEFRLIADWYYLAILNLAECRDASANPEHIAWRLGIAQSTVEAALSRLTRLGLLGVENGRLRRLTKTIETTSDVPSEAICSHHRQMLDRAIDSLAHDSVLVRHFESVVLALDPASVAELKTRIRAFTERVNRHKPQSAEQVYAVTVQMFPLSHELTGQAAAAEKS